MPPKTNANTPVDKLSQTAHQRQPVIWKLVTFMHFANSGVALKMLKQRTWALCLLLLHFLSSCTLAQSDAAVKPNIILIVADDMGFDDVSFRGSNLFLTPNIDALAYSGVILKNLYVPTMCTPSRSALLTGKYPINTGMQHYVIVNDQPWGLPLNETTMAEIFRNAGYHTSLFGKWHLGMSRRAFTPTMRGFDKHFGYLGSYIDYYDQTFFEVNKNYTRGHDFRNNLKPDYQHVGTYMTDLLTEASVDLIQSHNTSKQPLFLMLSHLAPHTANDDHPMQAPAEEIEKFKYITDEKQRIYAAMMSVLDKSVGLVVDALSRKGILNNTIILFYSDNGGPTVGQHSTSASNYPLRGQKNSPWEGGIRSSAAIWSPLIEKLGTVWKQKIYVADLLPTLAAAAGIDLPAELKFDGLNLWSALKYGYESVEREIVHNIDEIFQYVSYSKGKWKYINGSIESGAYDGWYGYRAGDDKEIDPRAHNYEALIQNTSVWKQLSSFNDNSGINTNITAMRIKAGVVCQFTDISFRASKPCNPLFAPCLFDIDVDPCEQNNLYEEHKNSKHFMEMLNNVEKYRSQAHAPNNKPPDMRCDPLYHKRLWTWWEDELEGNSALTLNLASFLKLFTIFSIFTLINT